MVKEASKIKVFWGNLGLTTRRIFWENRLLALFFYLAILANLASWGLIFWLLRLNQPEVILHYNSFMGVNRRLDVSTGFDFFEFFTAPLGGLVVLALNFLLVLLLVFSWSKVRSGKNFCLIEGKKPCLEDPNLSLGEPEKDSNQSVESNLIWLENKENRSEKDSEETPKAFLRTNLLAGYFLAAGAALVQLAILIHALAVLMVNVN